MNSLYKINHNSFTPIYHQIAQHLYQQILNGDIKEGDRLPSEIDLAHKFGVSRQTARAALAELEREGIATRKRGIGTFVKSRYGKKAAFILSHSFTEMIRELGLHPSSKVISKSVGTVSHDIAIQYGIPKTENVLQVTRLRLAEKVPVGIETAIIRIVVCPGMEDEDLENQSLYKLLAEKYHKPLYRLEQSLRAVLASKEQAAYLHIPEGTPLLSVITRGYTREGELVEITTSLFNSDRFHYKVYHEIE